MLIVTFDSKKGVAVRDGDAKALVQSWTESLARGETTEASVANALVISHLRIAVCEGFISHEQVQITVREDGKDDVQVNLDRYGHSRVLALGEVMSSHILQAMAARRRRERQEVEGTECPHL